MTTQGNGLQKRLTDAIPAVLSSEAIVARQVLLLLGAVRHGVALPDEAPADLALMLPEALIFAEIAAAYAAVKRVDDAEKLADLRVVATGALEALRDMALKKAFELSGGSALVQ